MGLSTSVCRLFHHTVTTATLDHIAETKTLQQWAWISLSHLLFPWLLCYHSLWCGIKNLLEFLCIPNSKTFKSLDILLLKQALVTQRNHLRMSFHSRQKWNGTSYMNGDTKALKFISKCFLFESMCIKTETMLYLRTELLF
jgi:hypothetical protein